jgi:hypothetical protein
MMALHYNYSESIAELLFQKFNKKCICQQKDRGIKPPAFYLNNRRLTWQTAVRIEAYVA